MSTNLLDLVERAMHEGTNTFFVELKFEDSILGGNPTHPTVFRTHMESRLRREAKAAAKRGDVPPTEVRIQEIVKRTMKEMFGDDVKTTIDKEEEKSQTTFKSNAFGPYIEPRQIKAMLREMQSTLGMTVTNKGSKQTMQHLLVVQACDEHGIAFNGERVNQVNFERGGETIAEIDDFVEMCAHIIGPQGRRSCIKRHGRIYGPSIRFLIRAPANLPKSRATAIVRDSQIVRMLNHGQGDGLGACRSQGYGKFKIVKLERTTNVRWLVGEDPPDSKKKKEPKAV